MNGMEDYAEFVTYEALRKRRRVSEFLLWMREAIEIFNKTEESRRFARLEKGAVGIYRDEAWPLFQFLRRLSLSDCDVSIPCDDGAADALLWNTDSQKHYANIQIVKAVDGYEDRLRMELLSSTGSSPATGAIKRLKNPRRIVANNIAVETTELIEARKTLVTTAIQRKCAKNYPQGTWLLVALDDALLRVDGITEIEKAAKECILKDRFDRAYLVGISDHHNLLVQLS